MNARAALALVAAALTGCGDGATMTSMDGGAALDAAVVDAAASSPCNYADAEARPDGRIVAGPFATRVVSFVPGAEATFGQSSLPDVVLGPPQGAGDLRGSTDVVSLGAGGVIVLGFDREIVDEPGDDFVVFENPFTVPGVTERYWEELGEVSVSTDGTTWTTFPCDAQGARPHTNCAGWNPVYSNPSNGLCAVDPRVSGGDLFDLAAVGVTSARFVRIRDLSTQGLMGAATGFDLDAVGVIHGR